MTNANLEDWIECSQSIGFWKLELQLDSMTFQNFLSLLNHASRKEKAGLLHSWCDQNLIKIAKEEKEESAIRLFETMSKVI